MGKQFLLWLFFLLSFFPHSLLSQSNDNNDNIITFGADARSGAPYCFADPNNPEIIKGFDVDIIHAVAEVMGKRAVFVQNSYEGLISGLGRNNYDVVIDGIVITPEHLAEVDFSTPYYVTSQTIVVPDNNKTINSLEDCRGKKVGTLTGSEAFMFLEKFGGLTVLSYEQEVSGYQDLLNGRIDAFIIDAPVAIYYVPTVKGLKIVGGAIDRLMYGIAVKKGNIVLRDELSAAIAIIKQNGKLRNILEKWKLWNKEMAELTEDRSPSNVEPTEYNSFVESMNRSISFQERIDRYISFLPMFAKAAWTTIVVSVFSMIMAISLGLILAIIRIYTPFKFIAVAYIEIIRGTPLLVQLLLIFYGLPNIGIRLDPFIAGVIGLGLNYAAFEAENYRAGLLSVPRSQYEAAKALGMTQWQALRHVILPQSVRLVIPPVTNDFISLLKDSSLVSMITIVDLTQQYNLLATTYYDYFGIGIQVALIYFIIGIPFVILSRWAERKIGSNGLRRKKYTLNLIM